MKTPPSECGLFPIAESATGYVFVFDPAAGAMYQFLAALNLISVLNGKQFSGTCECYIRPGKADGEYITALAIDRVADGAQPDVEWWTSFLDVMAYACEDDSEVRLLSEKCHPMSVAEMRAAFRHAGTAVFVSGLPHLIAYPDCPDPDSPFTGMCRKIREKYDEPNS